MITISRNLKGLCSMSKGEVDCQVTLKSHPKNDKGLIITVDEGIEIELSVSDICNLFYDFQQVTDLCVDRR